MHATCWCPQVWIWMIQAHGQAIYVICSLFGSKLGYLPWRQTKNGSRVRPGGWCLYRHCMSHREPHNAAQGFLSPFIWGQLQHWVTKDCISRLCLLPVFLPGGFWHTQPASVVVCACVTLVGVWPCLEYWHREPLVADCWHHVDKKPSGSKFFCGPYCSKELNVLRCFKSISSEW